MKINAVEIKPGNILEYEGRALEDREDRAHTARQGGAYMQVELKNLRDGRKNNIRFRSAESVEKVRLDQKDFQVLVFRGRQPRFHGQGKLLPGDFAERLLGDAAAFLQDGMDVVNGNVR